MRFQFSTHPFPALSELMRGLVILLFLFSSQMTFGAATFSRADDAPRLERVSFTARADGNGYVVRLHLSGRVSSHSPITILNDGSFQITLFRTRLDRRRKLDSPQGPIRSYRVDQKDGNVVINMELRDPDLLASAYPDRNTDDILIGLSAMESPAVNEVIARALTSEPKMNEVAERWTLDTIIIDAGHGGKDPGAVGAGGVREKDIVLSVALKLGQYIEEKLNINVVYTRDSDRFISLEGRGRLANQAGGKLFVSIHANAARNRSAKGTETYFLGLHKSEAARSVMDRENEVVQFEENREAYDDIDAMNSVRRTLLQSSYMRQSEGLAEVIEDQFHNRAGRKSRGVKQAGFYVLYGASMPAVLVELGFVTNPSESAFMKGRDGQAYLASAIFRAIKEYKTQYEKGLHLTASDR